MPDFGLDKSALRTILGLAPSSSANLVGDTDTQTLTNKTFNVNLNSLIQTTPALGGLLKDNGTSFVPLPRGTANQVLAVNSSGTDLVWAAAGGGGNVSTGQTNTYGDFDQIFRFGRIKSRNAANTFDHSLQSLATAARTWTMPDASDTATGIAVTQTLTNKTMSGASNTFTNIPSTALPSNINYLDVAQTITAADTYNDQTIKLRNPGNTFSYTLVHGAIGANRNLTLPAITGNDQITTDAFTTTLTNKTLDVQLNTLKQTTPALGALLKDNGTSFAPLAKGTANQVLTMNAGATDFAWAAPASGGGNVSTGQTNTYGAFDQIFRSGNLDLTNPANTFNYSFVGSAITAARNLTLPLLSADDTIAVLALAQTLTNKTISGAANTISNIPDSALTSNVNLLNAVQTVSAANTYLDQTVKLRNPANTFSYTVVHGAITANRLLTLPALTADDTVQTLAQAQTPTNKTINATNNTITDTSTAAGDLLKSNGTKFVRMARGTANQVLAVNSGGTDLVWAAAGGGGGGTLQYTYLFTVYKDSGDSLYKARNNVTGSIGSSNADAAVVLNYAVTNSAGLGGIFIVQGLYTLASTVNMAAFTSMKAEGRQMAELRPTGNFPALTFGSTARACVVDGVYFSHAQAGYTSALIQFQDGSNTNDIKNCDFYDFDTWAGTAIEFSNTATSGTGLGIFFNHIMFCDFFDFATAVKFTVSAGGGNWANGNEFICCLWQFFRTGVKFNGASGAQIDKNNFVNCEMQSDASSVCGFDYNDSAEHNYNSHISTMVWDLPAGGTYAKLNNLTELGLHNCFPDSDTYIGGTVNASRFARFGTYSGTDFSTVTEVAQNPVKKRWGIYQPGAGTTATTVGVQSGILMPHTPTGAGSNVNTFDTAEGIVINLVSGATANTNVGLVSSTAGVGIGRRLFGMKAQIRWAVSATGSSRMYFGFTSAATLPISDTPLATTDHGVLIGYRSTDTNFSEIHNDGSAAEVVNSLGVAKDTAYHTMEINWDASGNVNVFLDGTKTTITTRLPATTSNLFFNAVVQTTTTTARTALIHGIWLEADK